jgi:hypothetical protein
MVTLDEDAEPRHLFTESRRLFETDATDHAKARGLEACWLVTGLLVGSDEDDDD